MYCSNCGKKLNDGEKFCSGCGTRIGEEKRIIPQNQAKLPVVMNVESKNTKNKKPVGLIVLCCVLVIALLICGGVLLKDVLFPNYTQTPQNNSVSSVVNTPTPTPKPTATPTPEIDEDEVLYQETVAECKELKSNGEYIKILKKLESMIDYDTRYKKLYNEYKEEMINTVLKKAQDFAEEGDYETAIRTIAEEQADYPCNEFTEAIETYKNYLPVFLHNMSVFKMDTVGGSLQSRTDEVDAYTVDNYGNEYEHSVSVGKGYITFLLNYKYDKFEGTVAAPKGKTSDGYRESATLTIYGDDNELATFRDFSDTSRPQSFSIDVSGYEKITLSWSCKGSNIWKDWGYFATIFDGVFIPVAK